MQVIKVGGVKVEWLRQRLVELEQECKRHGVSLAVLAREQDVDNGWTPEAYRTPTRAIVVGEFPDVANILTEHSKAILGSVTVMPTMRNMRN